MNTQLTFIAAVLTLALSGCQVEGLTTGEAASDSNSANSTPTASNPNTGPQANPTEPTDTSETADVTIYWSAPIERVNGDLMAMNEVGGYEIRYKLASDDSYTNVVIEDGSVDQYTFLDIADAENYAFEVAVYDADGIYSDFVIAMAN